MGFGDFTTICSQNSIPLCALVGPGSIHLDSASSSSAGIMANCYARSVEVANTIIFQAATDTMHILALGMTIVMVLHVRSKFTAVGRKEITTFFYIYMMLTMVSLVLDAGVIAPSGASLYPYFTAIQNGLTSALCTCLLINGFVGFQLYEDGTTLSVWLLRLASLGMFVVSFAVSLLTFKGWAGLGPMNTTGLFVVLYIVNGVQLLIYLIMQIILVVNTLQDRWPLGDIAFGVFFFVVGQVILYTLSQRICENIQHYLDGMFFATICNLLAVMMVYKYWDSITKEDLEFSVGTKQNNWEVKEPFHDDRHASVFFESTGGSTTEYGGDTAPATSSLYQHQLGSVSQHRLSQHRLSGHGHGQTQNQLPVSASSGHTRRDSHGGHGHTRAHSHGQGQGHTRRDSAHTRNARRNSYREPERERERERDVRRDSHRNSHRDGRRDSHRDGRRDSHRDSGHGGGGGYARY